MGYIERRARRREWLAQEQEAIERWRAERRARNEPRREVWSEVWQNARPVLRVVTVRLALAVCAAIAF
jgi:hypothetical protein